MSGATPSERFERLRELFEDAIGMPPQQAQAWCEAATADDPDLRHELLELLGSDARPGPLALTVAVDVDGDGDETEPPPRAIGPWELLGKIGEGGSSSVYLARRRDRPQDRRFALKRLHGDPISPERHRQIVEEARVLAQLDHAGVARLVDADRAPDGTAYLVTEHVAGAPITEHCDQRRSTLAQRIDLMTKVCAAVQHAHANLVLHRDLKPANILVGDDGMPKLVDFGIARLLDAADGSAKTTSRALTPRYASPEQLLGGRLTTASDTYSLGVVLYELLTGRCPFEWHDRPLPELIAALGEASLRLPSRAADDGSAASLEHAARRGTTPAVLARALRGDLDRILGRALELDPQRRYRSPAELAAELDRYRRGVPVLARPATLLYLLGKSLRRHRLVAANAALAVLLLLAFSGSQARRARQAAAERDAAMQAERRASEVTRFLEEAFTASDPFYSGQHQQTARSVLDAAAARVDRGLAGDAALRAKLKRTLGGVYSRLGHHPEAIAQLRGALALERRSAPGSPAVAVTLQELALAELLAGRHRSAELGARLSCLLLEEAAASSSGRAADLATSLRVLADVLSEVGRQDEALLAAERAVALHERHLGREHAAVSTDLNTVTMIAYRQGALELALGAARRSLEIARRSDPQGDASRATVLHNLAAVLRAAGRLDEALEVDSETLALRERLFGRDSPIVANSLNSVALIELDLGRAATAEPTMRRALAIAEATVGDAHPLAIVVRANLAEVLDAAGKGAEALAVARRAVELAEEHLPDGYAPKSYAYYAGGTAALHAGDLAQARRWLEQARALRLANSAREADVALGDLALARLAHAEGRLAAAEQGYRAYEQASARLFAPHQWQRWWGAVQLAALLVETGRAPEAAPLASQAAHHLGSLLAAGDYRLLVAASVAARVEATLGQRAAATR